MSNIKVMLLFTTPIIFILALWFAASPTNNLAIAASNSNHNVYGWRAISPPPNHEDQDCWFYTENRGTKEATGGPVCFTK